MSFAEQAAAAWRQLQRRRNSKPNIRLKFDYRSRQGITAVERKEVKPLTAKEIAQLRYYLDDAKRNKRKYQILAVFISLAALVGLVFLFLELVKFLQHQPDDIF